LNLGTRQSTCQQEKFLLTKESPNFEHKNKTNEQINVKFSAAAHLRYLSMNLMTLSLYLHSAELPD
jgi:hypothetical protein